VDENELSNAIIGAAIEVHRVLGPGLLEGIYEDALCVELETRGLEVKRQAGMVATYKGRDLPTVLRLDLVVGDRVIVEIKSIDKLLPVHRAQLLSYLRMSGKKLGLLINFNTTMLKQAIRRVVNDL
jgi:GxxExxY protein